MSERFQIERLDRTHDRAAFRCSPENGTLEKYLTDDARARREHEKGVCTVHVLIDMQADPAKIAGYFTLSSETIVPIDLPPGIAKRYPRYPRWGAVKLGRMARDDAYSGQHLGVTLVRAAFEILLRIKDIGAIAMVVDAKNADLAHWYERTCGFAPFATKPLTLYIMKPTMEELLRASKREPT